MPREEISLNRISNTLEQERFFIVACEGFTEKNYIRQFATTYLSNSITHKIRVLDRNKEEESFSAPKHVLKQLKQFKEENSINKNDLCWMIIDKDRWHNLDSILSDCLQLGYNYAVSTPTFELWCLFHCIDLRNLTDETITRIQENPKVSKSSKKRFLEKKLSEEMQKLGLGGFRKKQDFQFNPNFFDASKVDLAVAQCKYFEDKEKEKNSDYKYPLTIGSQVFNFISNFQNYLTR